MTKQGSRPNETTAGDGTGVGEAPKGVALPRGPAHAALAGAWRTVGALAAVAARPVGWWSRWTGDAEGARDLAERLALPPALDELPAGGLWLHGASVGEIRALVPLARELASAVPDLPLVVTSTTRAGRARAAEETGGIARLAPIDAGGPLRRFIGRTAPRLHVIVETELWPARLAMLRRRGIPAALVSARLSPERVPQYRRLGALYGPSLAGFALVAPASALDRERLLAVGADPRRMVAEGNLKWEAAPQPASPAELESLRAALGIDTTIPWIVLGSVHPGEGWPIALATRAELGDAPVGWLLAPRHPDRYAEELREFDALPGAWRVSRGTAPAGTRVLVLDRIGLLPRVYAFARAGVLGGSFVPVGGHTPLEGAAAACPLVCGPFIDHQRDLLEPLLSAGGVVAVEHTAAAARQLASWIRHPDRAGTAGLAARREVDARRGVSARLARQLLELVR